MKRKSSIHIEKGNLGYCFHNTRQKPTANSIFSKEKNEYDNDALKAIEIYRNELKKREIAYTKRTGKKLHKNTITHLSAIVNLDERHTLNDLKKIADYLEETIGTKVFQIALHKDEGYIDEEMGKEHINYHGHIEMLGLDDQGNSVRRKLTKSYLIELQNKVAEILGMERGINYTREKKKRPKRLDTYEYKEYARRKARELKPVLQENKQLKKENEELKLSKKELEKQISELRKKMIEFNKNREEKEFTQEDYKYLSLLKRDLKTNSLKEVYEKLAKFSHQVTNRIKKLEEENKQLEEKLMQSETRVQELEEKNEELRKELNYITAPVDKEEFKDIVVENSILLYELNTKTNRIENTCDKVEWEGWYSVLSEIKPIEEENKKTKEELEETKNINKQLEEKIDYFEFWDNRNELIMRGYTAKIISYRLKLIEKKLKTLEDKLKELINRAIQKLENIDHDKANYMKKAFSKFLNNSSYSENSGNKVSDNRKIKR